MTTFLVLDICDVLGTGTTKKPKAQSLFMFYDSTSKPEKALPNISLLGQATIRQQFVFKRYLIWLHFRLGILRNLHTKFVRSLDIFPSLSYVYFTISF